MNCLSPRRHVAITLLAGREGVRQVHPPTTCGPSTSPGKKQGNRYGLLATDSAVAQIDAGVTGGKCAGRCRSAASAPAGSAPGRLLRRSAGGMGSRCRSIHSWTGLAWKRRGPRGLEPILIPPSSRACSRTQSSDIARSRATSLVVSNSSATAQKAVGSVAPSAE